MLYPVARSQLTWTTPADYSDLSVRARQAVALLTFHRWRRAVGLDCVELVTLEDHLWEFATVIPDTFDAWYQSHPLTQLGENDPLPRTIRDTAKLCGIDHGAMRRAINALIEITYGGLFGGVQSEWSLNELETVDRPLRHSTRTRRELRREPLDRQQLGQTRGASRPPLA